MNADEQSPLDEWNEARRDLMASGETLAAVVDTELRFDSNPNPQILTALRIHQERKAAEEAAYNRLIGRTL